MLDTKTKINTDTRRLIDMLEGDQVVLDSRSVAFIEDLHLFKHAVGVIYAVLINYTIPIKRKLAALQMLKSIFQTGISI
jgi:hypothetical protein